MTGDARAHRSVGLQPFPATAAPPVGAVMIFAALAEVEVWRQSAAIAAVLEYGREGVTRQRSRAC